MHNHTGIAQGRVEEGVVTLKSSGEVRHPQPSTANDTNHSLSDGSTNQSPAEAAEQRQQSRGAEAEEQRRRTGSGDVTERPSGDGCGAEQVSARGPARMKGPECDKRCGHGEAQLVTVE